MKFKYLIIGVSIAILAIISYFIFDGVIASVSLILLMITSVFFFMLEYYEFEKKPKDYKETVLCYIIKDDEVLMLKKKDIKDDMNSNKWLGVGGHIEEGEHPDDAILRETKEETGLTLTSYDQLGIIKFYMDGKYSEKIYVYVGYEVKGELLPCDEGTLQFFKKEEILNLPLWEGDKIFLKPLLDNKKFKCNLYYNGEKLTNYKIK
jgi:8-oxo-dGTP diphosphatase